MRGAGLVSRAATELRSPVLAVYAASRQCAIPPHVVNRPSLCDSCQSCFLPRAVVALPRCVHSCTGASATRKTNNVLQKGSWQLQRKDTQLGNCKLYSHMWQQQAHCNGRLPLLPSATSMNPGNSIIMTMITSLSQIEMATDWLNISQPVGQHMAG